MVRIYKGILLSRQKGRNLAACNDMDGPRGHCAEWTKPDRQRPMSYGFMGFYLDVESRERDKQIKPKHAHRYGAHFDGCQTGGGRPMTDRLMVTEQPRGAECGPGTAVGGGVVATAHGAWCQEEAGFIGVIASQVLQSPGHCLVHRKLIYYYAVIGKKVFNKIDK